MELCSVGIKAVELEFLNTLRKKLGQHTILTLQGSGVLILETRGMTIISYLDEMKPQNGCSPKKTRLPDVPLDEKSSPCRRVDSCDFYKDFGACRISCFWKNKFK